MKAESRKLVNKNRKLEDKNWKLDNGRWSDRIWEEFFM